MPFVFIVFIALVVWDAFNEIIRVEKFRRLSYFKLLLLLMSAVEGELFLVRYRTGRNQFLLFTSILKKKKHKKGFLIRPL